MTDTVVDIAQFFSYRGLPFPLLPLKEGKGQGGELLKFENHPTNLNTDYQVYDLLGRPIFQPIFLNDLYLPNAVLTVSAVNRIVSTPVVGRKGSVQETINTSDYEITIKGIIVNNDSNEYPISVLEEIHTMFISKETIILKSEITSRFEIDKVLIRSFSVPISEKQNVALFELSLISDFDYELTLL